MKIALISQKFKICQMVVLNWVQNDPNLKIVIMIKRAIKHDPNLKIVLIIKRAKLTKVVEWSKMVKISKLAQI